MKVFRFCFHCFFFFCFFFVFFYFRKTAIEFLKPTRRFFFFQFIFFNLFYSSEFFVFIWNFFSSLSLPSFFLHNCFCFSAIFHSFSKPDSLSRFFLYCTWWWWWWWRRCLNHFKLFIIFWLINLTFHSLNLMWNLFLRSMLRLSTKL